MQETGYKNTNAESQVINWLFLSKYRYVKALMLNKFSYHTNKKKIYLQCDDRGYINLKYIKSVNYFKKLNRNCATSF